MVESYFRVSLTIYSALAFNSLANQVISMKVAKNSYLNTYSGVPNNRVGPNKHVGWNFSKTIINVHFGIVSENPSKITIRYKKL